MNEIKNLKPFPEFCCSIGYIPTSYKISMTYEEQIQYLIKYVEEKVNEIQNSVTGFFEEIEKTNQNFEDLKNSINSDLEAFKINVLNDVQNELSDNFNNVIKLISDYQITVNNNLSNLREDLENEIERIELGDVQAYNPTNGLVENVSKVIMDIYEILRNNAINVDEFEDLDLSATNFDAKQISAYNFDVNGKTFLLV